MTKQRQAGRTLIIVSLAGGLVATAAVLGVGSARSTRAGTGNPATPIGSRLPGSAGGPTDTGPAVNPQPPEVAGAQCAAAVQPKATHEKERGNPEARRAAQRGLGFLSREAVAWQDRHQCYGCHVQAVTVEALAIGVHHQYDVDKKALDAIVNGMVNLTGGAAKPEGLWHSSPSIGESAKVLGAVAFARYDALVGTRLGDELAEEAKMLLARQKTGGEVPMPWTSAPIATNQIQSTALAIATWKRMYDRTADDQWLTAIQRAEEALRRDVEAWGQGTPDLQSVDYAIMGLVSAGVGTSEDLMVDLAGRVRKLQNSDGGWGFGAGQLSTPFATGQALYTLRLMGMTDKDPVIARGTEWLIKQQHESGGWSEAGFGKAEAMWAVLGLVSIDVLTIHVAGAQDGQHLSGSPLLSIEAKDNQGGQVVKIELELDDRVVASTCGSALSWTWPEKFLGQGRRVLDVRATNARGEVSRRRIEVFTGDHYMTQLGSRFVDGKTEITLRDITDAGKKSTIGVEIFKADDADKATGDAVWTSSSTGGQGARSFAWDGKEGGKYVARLTYKDEGGKVRQTESVPFVHDTLEKQQGTWSQISGAVSMPGGGGAGNAEVELWDDDGNLVGKTRSTKDGNYRFRNAKPGKAYKVVVKKDGYVAPAASVPAPEAGEAQAAPIDMKKH